MREALDLFISYAHEDEALRAEFDQHLALLERQGEIRPWEDREIAAGDEWRGQIHDRLETADLILLLVSSSFLASDYCFDIEANRALERHVLGQARVIPVIVRPCDWTTSPFAELQALPKDGEPVKIWADRDQAWLDVVQGLRLAIAEVRSARGEAPSMLQVPDRHDERQPRYANDESRQLSCRLKSLFKRRKDLTLAGDDTVALEAEILEVRRLLRKGPQLLPGEFLGDGRYELTEVIGQGGFATVWKAWDSEGHRPVALKVLHGHYSEDRGKRERFFRGARKMAELAHPHIVQVLEVERADEGWYFFVMEYLVGENFEQVVLRGELTPERRLEVLLQVGGALEHAHQQGVIHRDVKPSNILLDKQHAKLSDFDLVRAADTTGLTATRAMLGTVQFAAPEALESAGEAGPAADVYSLASTVVFALAGGRLPPWYYRDPARAIAGLDCGDEPKQVLERAIAFEVAERTASIAEFCQTLSAAAGRPFERSSRLESVEPHPMAESESAELAGAGRETVGESEGTNREVVRSRRVLLFIALVAALALVWWSRYPPWMRQGTERFEEASPPPGLTSTGVSLAISRQELLNSLNEDLAHRLREIHRLTQHALIIGVSSYAHFPPLETVRSDTEELAWVLSERYGFQTRTLKDPSRLEFMKELNSLRYSLAPRDRLLIYYTGRGRIEALSGICYWLPANARPDEISTWIPTGAISDYLDVITARQILVVSDSCYSGTMFSWPGLSSADRRSRRALLSGSLHPMPAAAGDVNSPFAQALLTVLRLNDRPLPGVDLYQKVTGRIVSSNSKLGVEHVPLYATIRRSGHEAGDFVLVPLDAAGAAAPPVSP